MFTFIHTYILHTTTSNANPYSSLQVLVHTIFVTNQSLTKLKIKFINWKVKKKFESDFFFFFFFFLR